MFMFFFRSLFIFHAGAGRDGRGDAQWRAFLQKSNKTSKNVETRLFAGFSKLILFLVLTSTYKATINVKFYYYQPPFKFVKSGKEKINKIIYIPHVLYETIGIIGGVGHFA